MNPTQSVRLQQIPIAKAGQFAGAAEGKYTIAPRDVYGDSFATIPQGYEAFEFRPPLSGELYLTDSGGLCTAEFSWGYKYPRLILRKVQQKKVTFVHTGVVRPPKKGEFYVSSTMNGLYNQAPWDFNSDSVCEIVERKEVIE